MSYVYDDNGQLSKVLFEAKPEPEPQAHWYDVGTRIVFIQVA